MIFLARGASNQKQLGQTLLGQLDIEVDRNHFERQKHSFEFGVRSTVDGKLHNGIFIRAPGILKVGKAVEVLGHITIGDLKETPVAVRQGSMLATSFHPELTMDPCWHNIFLDMIKKAKAPKTAGAGSE